MDEVHLEMASREFAELGIIRDIAERGMDVCVGIIDVKSYFIEQPDRRGRSRAPLSSARSGRPSQSSPPTAA